MNTRIKAFSKIIAALMAVGFVGAILEAMPFGERKNKVKE